MNKAFTLIEVIIAIAILGGITVVLSQSFFAISRANTKAELIKDIKQAGDFSIHVMRRMIRVSTGIRSVCDGNPDPNKELIISNSDGYQTRFHCVFETINGRPITRLASSSGAFTHYLTPANVTMGGANCATSTLQFICTQYSSQPSSVEIFFTLSQAGVSSSNFEIASMPFQTTVNARN